MKKINTDSLNLTAILNNVDEFAKIYYNRPKSRRNKNMSDFFGGVYQNKVRTGCCDNMEIISVMSQCNDRCSIGGEDPDYLDRKWGIGDGDCIEFEYCANCGKIKGDFPLDL